MRVVVGGGARSFLTCGDLRGSAGTDHRAGALRARAGTAFRGATTIEAVSEAVRLTAGH